MLVQILTLLATTLLGFLGFFYSKAGERNKIGGVGLAILALMVFGAVVNFANFYDGYIENSRRVISSQLAKELSVKAQNASILSILDVDKKFDYANLNLNTYLQLDQGGEPIKGSTSNDYYFGLVPSDLTENESVRLALKIEELAEQSVEITNKGGRVLVAETRGEEPAKITAYGENGCRWTTSGCGFEENEIIKRQGWFFEAIAFLTGGGFLFESNDAALVYVGKFQQASNIGTLQFASTDRAKIKAFSEHYLQNVTIDVRLIQNRVMKGGKTCSIVVKVPAKLSKSEQCDAPGVCFSMDTAGAFDLEICENSQI